MSTSILVIDDDTFMAKIVALCLASCGDFQIIPAFDGAGGLRAAAQAVPDLVVLDFDLPDQDGLAVLQALRRGPAALRVPVIAVTGALADLPRCAELVVESDAFLSKPLDFQALRRSVLQLLRRPAAVAA